MFLTVDGGLGRLVERLADGLGDRVRTQAAVDQIARLRDGWQVRTGTDSLEVDDLVLALPAHVAARLLAGSVPAAATHLAAIDHASVAVVTLAFDRRDAAEVPDGSGMLVPRTEGRLVKAATWSSGKWPHLAAADHWLLRCSVGRIDDLRGLGLDDTTLADRVEHEVRGALGLSGPAVARLVTRWDQALPQYDVGHLERVAAIRDALPAGLHVVGAGYDGIGIAPCVAAAERTAGAIS